MIGLRLDFPPVSTNHMYRKTRRGVFLTDKARKYKADAYAIALEARQGHDLSAETWSFTWMVYLPDLRNRDLDNLLKIPQDGVCEALGINDNAITEVKIVKAGLDRNDPRIILSICESAYNPYAELRKRGGAKR